MKYDIILMDADDTLFDFKRAEAHAVKKLCAQHRLPDPERAYTLYSKINRSLWKQLERGEISQAALRLRRFELLARELGLALDAAALNQDYSAALGEGAFLIDGALELCRALSALAPIYIVTNGISDIQRSRLSRCALHPYIKEMFVSQQLGCAKPSPAYFDEVFARLGNPPRSRAILLGDSLTSDMRGGRAAGIATCWFSPEGLPKNADCDYQIAKLEEFLALVL